jgi:hypothetical protein
MGLLDAIRDGSYTTSEDAPTVVAPGRHDLSLARVAERVVSGDSVMAVARDFLDQAGLVGDAELADLIVDRPSSTGSRQADALLAGLAEHLAAVRRLTCPRWVNEPDRFLDRFWFVSGTPGFRAIAIAQTPIALKRRGIFWPASSLRRV